MQIWSAEIKELEVLYASLKGRFPELEKELEQLIETKDTNVILIYSRRCLEVIITELCECELKRPRKTEPLKGIIDKLSHEEKVPSHIIASMQYLNSISTFGAHPKDFDTEQVKPVLSNLAIIIKWYIKFKEPQTIIKTEPEEVKYESKEPVESKEGTKKSKKRLIFLLSGALLVMAIIVMALFVFNIIGWNKQTRELEKSIAVLPFLDDSQDKENTAFINGIMDEVLINLQTIKDLRVISRNSVEQYRGLDKSPTPDIAKALGVNYIVEGSGQKYENTFRIRVQLIEAVKDQHLWGESYEQKIEKVEDIFNIQNQIAEAIAKELKAIITPEEKQLIEKSPTISLTAYDFFQRGREEHQKYWSDYSNKEALEKAVDLYHKALEYDSKFAQAYLGLAQVYWDKNYWSEYFSEKFMDSVLILTNKALSIDDQLSGAYIVRGNFYYTKGLTEKAVEEYDKALKYNPNEFWAYYQKAMVYATSKDYVQRIDNMNKAVARYRGENLPDYLRTLARSYIDIGFFEKGKYYIQEAFTLDRDSATYFFQMALLDFFSENFIDVYKNLQKSWAMDSTRNSPIIPMECFYYLPSEYYEEAYLNAKKWIEYYKKSGEIPIAYLYRIGMALWHVGKYEEAEYYFKQEIKYEEEEIKLNRARVESGHAYYNAAASYAVLGEKEKAYKYLNEFNKQKVHATAWLLFIKNDPFFDNIRNEERFQNIVKDMETKYKAEHERVRKWLEEQGEI